MRGDGSRNTLVETSPVNYASDLADVSDYASL